MSSLEKKMFFLPNKLFIRKDRIYVSFNLSVIPSDMKVTFMELHIPLIKLSKATNVYVKEITGGWSEKMMKKGIFPPRSKLLKQMKCNGRQDNLIIDVTIFRSKWRLKKKLNHGIYVKLKDTNIKYLEENPPYLIIDTI
ncbi:hypothetical protein [Alkaliphilus peptidifermentans]|uniref:Uncharacterized protein n=1 Tax=Alkaliphilus peptidifermentans DSM 18978 TaxID=1120976 RepID=A0A1G5H1Q9_9FIRM|nr:hypothetical protein [Alkaliphilus peptidifermentans]SCY57674.1 hypothetical protein SAMN03080606_01875 [Alkaliphilus peptidifermentans DSM 18978]